MILNLARPDSQENFDLLSNHISFGVEHLKIIDACSASRLNVEAGFYLLQMGLRRFKPRK